MVKLPSMFHTILIYLLITTASCHISSTGTDSQQILEAPAPRINDLYNEAIGLLSTVQETKKYTYTESNIENDLKIPPYDKVAVEIDNLLKLKNLPDIQKTALENLHYCASLNHTAAIATLAEINMFGNYSIPHNGTQALEYYTQLVSLKPDANAYYMLGFIHATGLFGEVKVNQPMADLYFNFGMENGDLRSTMILAYRSLHGISLESNCGIALNYYSHIASQTKKLITDGGIGGPNIDTYSMRISDFNGGLFGEDASESLSSLVRTKQNHGFNVHIFNEINIDPEEHESVSLYYEAIAYYEGDYFTKRDYKKAFDIVNKCSLEGSNLMRNDAVLDKVDIIFISRCHSMLGHMFLRGEGTPQNYEQALYWLKKTKESLSSSSQANNDLGMIYEYGLGTDIDLTLAKKHYKISADSRSADGMYNLARLQLANNHLDNIGLELMQSAAFGGNIEAMYQLGQLYERGFGEKSCETTAAIFKIFVEAMEPMLTSFEWAFDELLRGNYRNALIGYAMAAEQGYETGQASAAYLLYQPSPKIDIRKNPIDEDRLKIALNYITRSSKQNNLDSTVTMGDIYYKGLLNGEPDYTKAVACYQVGVNQHCSQASFNLGYMYEHGLGVDKDFHLAKRYYDFALEYHQKSYLPVKLATLNLKFKSFFTKSIDDDEAKPVKTTRTFNDWLNVFNKARLGNTDPGANARQTSSFNQPTGQQQQGQEQQVDEELTEIDMDDIIILVFFGMAFFLFYIMHYLNQRRVQRRNEDDNGEVPPVRRNFQFNFGVVAI